MDRNVYTVVNISYQMINPLTPLRRELVLTIGNVKTVDTCPRLCFWKEAEKFFIAKTMYIVRKNT